MIEYYKNQWKKTDPLPETPTFQPFAPRPEIRRDVDNIAWNFLNSEANFFVKAHKCLEALEAKSAGLLIPEYISRRGRGKFHNTILTSILISEAKLKIT